MVNTSSGSDQNRLEEQMENGKQDNIVIDFIDPLFAVVLHISFVEVMGKPWFSDLRLIFHEPYFFQLGTLFLAYLTIINSWIGYHHSIKNNPIDVSKSWGRCRFLLDILLLIGYFILVVNYENFRRELWVLAIVYLIFFLWDQSKRAEIPETSQDSSARRGVTVLWLFVFVLFVVIHSVRFFAKLISCLDWFILIAAIGSTILYRINKAHLTSMRRLLLFLGYPTALG